MPISLFSKDDMMEMLKLHTSGKIDQKDIFGYVITKVIDNFKEATKNSMTQWDEEDPFIVEQLLWSMINNIEEFTYEDFKEITDAHKESTEA